MCVWNCFTAAASWSCMFPSQPGAAGWFGIILHYPAVVWVCSFGIYLLVTRCSWFGILYNGSFSCGLGLLHPGSAGSYVLAFWWQNTLLMPYLAFGHPQVVLVVKHKVTLMLGPAHLVSCVVDMVALHLVGWCGSCCIQWLVLSGGLVLERLDLSLWPCGGRDTSSC